MSKSNIPPHNKLSAEDKRFASPAKELSFAISFVTKVYKELKPGVYHSKEEIAAVQNLAVNSIKSLLSTAQQYNLLELKYGVGYKVSSLFEKIYLSVKEKERKESILESLNHPPVYHDIFTEYNGKVFPGVQEMNKFVSEKYNIKNSVASRIVEILFENLKEYKLINASGILSLDAAAPETIENEQNTIERQTEIVFEKAMEQPAPLAADTIIKNNSTNVEMFEIIIPLKNKSKAFLKIPEDHTNTDLEKIARIVQAYKEIILE